MNERSKPPVESPVPDASPTSMDYGTVRKTRRRVTQSESLQTRLETFAKEAREKATTMPAGPERDAWLKKAREAETTSRLDDWVNSPGLKPPV